MDGKNKKIDLEEETKMRIKHCDDCNGKGVINTNECKTPGCLVYHVPNYVNCLKCGGTGHLVELE